MRTYASTLGLAALSTLTALGASACKKPAPDAVDAAPAPESGPATAANPLSKQIGEDFGKKYGCPADRVVVKVRADLASDRAEYTTFEVDGCDHTQILACRPHHAHGAVYPEWPDCEETAPPKAAVTLATLGTASLDSATSVPAPDMVGTYASFDPVANYDWATALATAWSPDAKLFQVRIEHAALDGTVDLSPAGVSSALLFFNSVAKGDVDLDVEVYPFQVRHQDGGAGTVSVKVQRHSDATARRPVPKPTCTLARAVAALRGTLAKANPAYRLDATLQVLASGKSVWTLGYAVGDPPKGMQAEVDAATCAIEHP